ncbi:Maf family protein [Endozoicomonas elysicola]|uniref:dTTP/UTP pyrophosphatase n=1 Tax=Endozoicomonas elysicola TaxID=305900 RepID=A0A081KA24_9GAMM|nr:Maf family protein [Endozoicomonas elysicola]KEI71000.1 septum formation protein Maf [Endozoicomonas elysicola]
MIYLASQSPRRAELLKQIGVPFQKLICDIDETPFSQEAASDYVLRMAREKAEAGWQEVLSSGSVKMPLLAADTTVVCNNQILGKPRNTDDARHMLKMLSGNTHQVMSAVAITDGEQHHSEISVTNVVFNKLTDQLIKDYIATGEPMDKAGGYGIQGYGAVLVASISGSYSAVVGLPLMETSHLLDHFNILVWQA